MQAYATSSQVRNHKANGILHYLQQVAAARPDAAGMFIPSAPDTADGTWWTGAAVIGGEAWTVEVGFCDVLEGDRPAASRDADLRRVTVLVPTECTVAAPGCTQLIAESIIRAVAAAR